ncbi:Translocon-associated protein subunit alpha [Echinococcus granulosus]|uniref:Translocon-associated protein subunit alpha n=1 Tax=Echinococcus granulosus TaxID=6210 RepID=U6J9A4_ECHGR|nr:Translocon-associated protein subunit alpha [Echinococcus granulosus]EUB62852.1 Translocon-associated protein subunit alpha [Echinococcus granulosus]KAH9280505.1 Translocon-associated protein subunit alpha [Echinococcus granulosus]CDS19027.1 Translocon associated protein subunit alpha [Echinococcus granulosus]
MLRLVFVVLAFLSIEIFCQEVEISDEELFVQPQPAPSEELHINENDFYTGSPDMSAILSFVDPPLGQLESPSSISLVAGKPASFIVLLENSRNSSNSYSLQILEAALHYPRYFGYHIQNFTVQRLQNTLEPKQQASLHYTFVPAAELTGQHFDLAVILTYHDQTGKLYSHALFNETIAFLEDAEGMDFELIFLGLMIVGVCVLVLIFIWHWISKKAGRRPHGGKPGLASNGTDGMRLNEYVTKKSPRQPNSGNGNVNSKMKHRQGKK